MEGIHSIEQAHRLLLSFLYSFCPYPTRVLAYTSASRRVRLGRVISFLTLFEVVGGVSRPCTIGILLSR